MSQDDTDAAWDQQENEERRQDDRKCPWCGPGFVMDNGECDFCVYRDASSVNDLKDVLKDIAQSHKLLDKDPEYAEWSEKLSREAREQQDKEHDEPI